MRRTTVKYFRKFAEQLNAMDKQKYEIKYSIIVSLIINEYRQ
jgi:hypothetical protein